MTSTFKIGTTSGGITSLDALAVPLPDPQWEYQQYAKMKKLANGLMRGQGFPKVVWQFPLLEDAQIEQVFVFLSSTSAIYIQSKKRNNADAVLEVLMNVPDPRQDGDHADKFQGFRSGLQVEFTVLSEVTP